MKLKINGKTYEKNKLSCGIMTEYYDVMDVVEESENVHGRTTSSDLKLIKEFICNFFDNQFSTDDIDKDENLEQADLQAFWLMITQEVNEKTKNKLEKLLKK